GDVHRRSRKLRRSLSVLDAVADQRRGPRSVHHARADRIAVEDGLEGLRVRALEGSVEDEVGWFELRRPLRLLGWIAAPSRRKDLRGRGVCPDQRHDRCCDYDGGAHGPHGPTAGSFHRSSSADGGSTVWLFVSRWIRGWITARRPPGAETRRCR